MAMSCASRNTGNTYFKLVMDQIGIKMVIYGKSRSHYFLQYYFFHKPYTLIDFIMTEVEYCKMST